MCLCYITKYIDNPDAIAAFGVSRKEWVMSRKTNEVKGSGKAAVSTPGLKGFDSCNEAKLHAITSLKTKSNTWFRVYKLDGRFYPAWHTAQIPKGAVKVAGYARTGGRWEGNGHI